jgi:hypothetical protein
MVCVFDVLLSGEPLLMSRRQDKAPHTEIFMHTLDL